MWPVCVYLGRGGEDGRTRGMESALSRRVGETTAEREGEGGEEEVVR